MVEDLGPRRTRTESAPRSRGVPWHPERRPRRCEPHRGPSEFWRPSEETPDLSAYNL